MTGDILFNDGVKAKYGTSSDLQIFHDGSDSYITDSGTGIIFLRTNQLKIQSDDGLETYGVFTDNGAVNLYHNGSEKFATTSTGIDVTGKIQVTSTDPEIFLTDSTTNVDHSIDGNSGVGNLFIHVDKNNEGSDPKFIVNVGSTDELIVATETGYVGIGAPSPDNRLHIFDNNSDISMDSNASGQLHIDGNAYGFGIALDADAANIYTNSSSRDLVFGVNETEVARVKPAGLDVTGATNTTGASNTRQWSVGTAGAKMGVYALDNSTMYMRVESGTSTNLQFGTYDNIPIYTITNNTVRTTLLGNGNFGVGTTSPTAKMHIKDVTNTTGSTTGSTLLRLDNDVNGDLSQQKTFIDFALFDSNANEIPQVRIGAEVGPNSDASSQEKEGEGAFVIYTNNATTGGTTPTGLNERMRVDYLGNVGIGTSTPSAKLDCNGDARFNNSVQIQADSGYANMEIGGPSGAYIDLKKPFSDDYDFRVIYDGTASLKTTGNYVSTSTASGYVHIGPQNSSYCHFSTDRTRFYFNQNLVVSGNRVVSSYGGDLLLQRGQSSTQQISIGLSQVVMTGQLNIAGANPSSNNGAFEVPVISSSTPAIVSVSAGTTSLRTHHSFENSNGQVGKINTLGTQTIYSTSSDYRLKTDVQPMQGSIDRVKALKPCNFEWITDGTRVDGFIAHEAQEVVPEAVIGEKDGMRDKVNIITPLVEATYDQEGNELTAEIPAVTETEQVPDYQGIDQSKIVPLLTSALQDAIAKIEALETRLEALES